MHGLRLTKVGAVPGALVGGFVAVALPETALRLVLVGAVGLAVARELVQRAKHPPKALSWLAWTPSGATIVPVTFGAGVLTATGGAGALLLTPLLLACGFKNERFVVAADLFVGEGQLSEHVPMGRLVRFEARCGAKARHQAGSIVAGVQIDVGAGV